MNKQTFAEKMAKAKADRKRNIKLSICATVHASKLHTGQQKSQYTQPLTPTQIKIQENEKRIKEIREYLYQQYKTDGHTAENAQERKELNAEKMVLLTETHYLRNPQRTPEMDEGSGHEAGAEYQQTIAKPAMDRSSSTFGEFDAEWD